MAMRTCARRAQTAGLNVSQRLRPSPAGLEHSDSRVTQEFGPGGCPGWNGTRFRHRALTDAWETVEQERAANRQVRSVLAQRFRLPPPAPAPAEKRIRRLRLVPAPEPGESPIP